ncbi:MAG: FAD binding domain-containing protein [Candidatus Binatia bacterium]
MSDLPALRYSRPRRLAEALTALARPGACVYAGGTDLLVALAERRPWVRFVREVVDIKALEAARGITRVDGVLRIGALVTADELMTHAGVRRHAPALAEAASQTAAPALRRRGTVGGNLVTPHPAGDVTTALVALGAVVEVADGRRVRALPIAQVLTSQAETWPRQRLILAVRVPRARRSAFEKLAARGAFGRAVVAVAVVVYAPREQVALDGRREHGALDGPRVQVALGGMRARPCLAPATAVAWRHGGDLVAALAADCDAAGEARASAHRLRMAAVLATRAFTRARA